MQTYQDAPEGSDLVPLTPEYRSPEGAGDAPEGEETLIVDHRANLGPAQLVENKLSNLLGGALPPVSHIRMQTKLGGRSHC